MRLVALNTENLFVLVDDSQGVHEQLPESVWQRMSSSIYNNKPLKKIRALVESMKLWQADVYVLSEIGGLESLVNLNRYFLDQAFDVHLLEGNSDRNIDVGYLCRKNLGLNFEIFSNKNHKLKFAYAHQKSEAEPLYFSRDVAELHVLDAHGNRRLMIFAVHLKSKRDTESVDPSGTQRRRAEFEALFDIVNARRLEHPNAAILIAGDFNGQVHGENQGVEFAKFNETGWQDVFDLKGVDPLQRTTFFPMDMSGRVAGLQLDYVFLQNIPPNMVLAARVGEFHNPFGLPIRRPANPLERELIPSDHFPVIVDFTDDFLQENRD